MAAKQVSKDEFLEDFEKLKAEEHVLVDFGAQQSLAVKVHPFGNSSSKALVVLFHGAISRKPENNIALPAFLNGRKELGDSAFQISISDPSIQEDNSVGIGWFAGNEQLPLQKILPEFFSQLSKQLNVERVIFHGSSAGGFAALYYSWHLDGSVACVSVPQTSAYEYRRPTLNKYLEVCWPNTAKEDYPCLDVKLLYGNEVPNLVSYVQSSRDEHHVKYHMIPFLASISPENQEKIAIKVSYWGKEGHSGTVPPEERDAWMKAAITAEAVTSSDVINSYQKSGTEITPLSQAMMRAAGVKKEPTSRRTSGRTQQERFQDLNWANTVVKHQKESL
ncbi:hypothetical protein [Corynebacterium casei]|uniref:hypothetical protein n=1 Tax=Corynebacterium casei TaxID=160386 RepID=UPI003FD20957